MSLNLKGTWSCQQQKHQPGLRVGVSKHKRQPLHQDTLTAYADPMSYFATEEVHSKLQFLPVAFLALPHKQVKNTIQSSNSYSLTSKHCSIMLTFN